MGKKSTESAKNGSDKNSFDPRRGLEQFRPEKKELSKKLALLALAEQARLALAEQAEQERLALAERARLTLAEQADHDEVPNLLNSEKISSIKKSYEKYELIKLHHKDMKYLYEEFLYAFSAEGYLKVPILEIILQVLMKDDSVYNSTGRLYGKYDNFGPKALRGYLEHELYRGRVLAGIIGILSKKYSVNDECEAVQDVRELFPEPQLKDFIEGEPTNTERSEFIDMCVRVWGTCMLGGLHLSSMEDVAILLRQMLLVAARATAYGRHYVLPYEKKFLANEKRRSYTGIVHTEYTVVNTSEEFRVYLEKWCPLVV